MRDLLRASGAIVLLVLVATTVPSPTRATVHTVNQSGVSFVPADITVTEGDTVRWVWADGSHTVTNGTGAGDPSAGTLFDHALDSFNPTFEYVFATAGNYPYFCRPHELFGMKGSVTVDVATGVRTPAATIATLGQNTPNPFEGQTEIVYNLVQGARVRLTIYDALGRFVAALDDGHRAAGIHRVVWNGRDAAGARRAAGVYFYRLSAGATVQTKKLVLIR